nr:uncharacterized protein LOC123290314 [Equus asinus]
MQISEVLETSLHASMCNVSVVPPHLTAAMSPVEKPHQRWLVNCSRLCHFQARVFSPAADSVSYQIASGSFGFLAAVKQSSWPRLCFSPDSQPPAEWLARHSNPHFCMPGKNKTAKRPECSRNAIAGLAVGPQAASIVQAREAGPGILSFPENLCSGQKEPLSPGLLCGCCPDCGPGVTCCRHLSACFLPLSVGAQKLGPCSLL